MGGAAQIGKRSPEQRRIDAEFGRRKGAGFDLAGPQTDLVQVDLGLAVLQAQLAALQRDVFRQHFLQRIPAAFGNGVAGMVAMNFGAQIFQRKRVDGALAHAQENGVQIQLDRDARRREIDATGRIRRAHEMDSANHDRAQERRLDFFNLAGQVLLARLPLNPEPQSMRIGIKDKYFVMLLGDESLEDIFADAAPATHLAHCGASMPVGRHIAMTYVDIRRP